jgi:hypothetical protein
MGYDKIIYIFWGKNMQILNLLMTSEFCYHSRSE